ncbi:putative replication protein [uncultured virus]|uniref:ATP-dependent helicase Rep n=1 Tax=uncultured virus TaxID=340016 RepID=A0A1I9XGD7_9VIRU|nr:putative replication protein [uncultured virus]
MPKVDKKPKHRNWVFTLNNPTEDDRERLLSWPVKFVKFQLEKGEKTGTPHYQGMVILQNAGRLTGVKKTLCKRAYWAPMKSLEGSLAYCEKADSRVEGPWEAGTPPKKQGERTDLHVVRDSIVSGATTVDEITLKTPMVYHQYGRTLHRIEDLVLRKRFRTEMTQGKWYFGDTGVGKSHTAFEGYTPETHYVWKNDNGWQDGYVGQATVIINDFRGSIKYDELLQLVDKWPYTVPRRGREPAPFLATTVIITSSLPPEEVYTQRVERDSLDQLSRRFEIFEISKTGSEVNITLRPPLCQKPLCQTYL